MGLLHLRAITFLLVSFLLLTTCNKQVAAQEVRFFTGTWEEAKELAAHSNKPIFVKTYADWCMPCKQMEKYTFKDRDLANFYNNYFINLKINIESVEGKRFKEQFGVSGVPDLLFFDANGQLVHREVGGRSIAQMKMVGRQVQLDMGNTSIGDTFADVRETPAVIPDQPRSRSRQKEVETPIFTYKEPASMEEEVDLSVRIVDGIVVAPPPSSNLDEDQTSLTSMYTNRPVRRTLTGATNSPIESIIVMKEAEANEELLSKKKELESPKVTTTLLVPSSATTDVVVVDGVVSAAPPVSGIADLSEQTETDEVVEVEADEVYAAALAPPSVVEQAIQTPHPTSPTPTIEAEAIAVATLEKKPVPRTVIAKPVAATTNKVTYKLASYTPATHKRLYPQYAVPLERLHAMYEAGEYRGSFLYEYAYRLKSYELPTTKIVNQYLQRQRSRGNLNQPRNMQFVYDFMGDYNSNSLIILVNNLADYHRIYGKDRITDRFKQSVQLGIAMAGKAKDEGELQRLIQLSQKAQLEDEEMFVFLIQSDFYEDCLNWEKYAVVTRQYMRNYTGNDAQFLYRKAWNLMRASDKKKDVQLAREWLERSVEIEDQFYNNEALARMLYKLGKKKECRLVMNHALELAKAEEADVSRLMRLKEELGE